MQYAQRTQILIRGTHDASRTLLSGRLQAMTTNHKYVCTWAMHTFTACRPPLKLNAVQRKTLYATNISHNQCQACKHRRTTHTREAYIHTNTHTQTTRSQGELNQNHIHTHRITRTQLNIHEHVCLLKERERERNHRIVVSSPENRFPANPSTLCIMTIFIAHTFSNRESAIVQDRDRGNRCANNGTKYHVENEYPNMIDRAVRSIHVALICVQIQNSI